VEEKIHHIICGRNLTPKKKCKRNNYAEETKICSYVLNIKVAYKRVEKFL
jgi:hypothetical protein